MENDKLLVGWFMQCLACRATFVRITPANYLVEAQGRILRPNPIGSGQEFAGFVKCPDCLSESVRLMELGDRE